MTSEPIVTTTETAAGTTTRTTVVQTTTTTIETMVPGAAGSTTTDTSDSWLVSPTSFPGNTFTSFAFILPSLGYQPYSPDLQMIPTDDPANPGHPDPNPYNIDSIDLPPSSGLYSDLVSGAKRLLGQTQYQYNLFTADSDCIPYIRIYRINVNSTSIPYHHLFQAAPHTAKISLYVPFVENINGLAVLSLEVRDHAVSPTSVPWQTVPPGTWFIPAVYERSIQISEINTTQYLMEVVFNGPHFS